MDYLISDLHLEESRPDITGAFFYFLEQIKNKASRLYILGDFFESWVGDDENTPLQRTIKNRLKELNDQGVQIYFMAGNRDFLIGEQFSKETGVTILDDPSSVMLAGQHVLIMHGDSLCTLDHSYMKLRKMIRNPAFIETFLARSLDDRLTTARQLREMSMANNQGKANEIMDVTPEEVERVMHENDSYLLIHGHTHRPDTHQLNINNRPATRFVLGDWDQGIWFIEADDNTIKLKNQDFPANPEQYAPRLDGSNI